VSFDSVSSALLCKVSSFMPCTSLVALSTYQRILECVRTWHAEIEHGFRDLSGSCRIAFASLILCPLFNLAVTRRFRATLRRRGVSARRTGGERELYVRPEFAEFTEATPRVPIRDATRTRLESSHRKSRASVRWCGSMKANPRKQVSLQKRKGEKTKGRTNKSAQVQVLSSTNAVVDPPRKIFECMHFSRTENERNFALTFLSGGLNLSVSVSNESFRHANPLRF